MGDLDTASRSSVSCGNNNGAAWSPLAGALGDDEEYEKMREAGFSQDVVDLLRTPSVYRSFGLTGAPSTIRHMTLEDWVVGKRMVE